MFKLPDLPYAYGALEPYVSSTTMHTHHDKHHRTYVETTNRLLTEAGQRPESLEAVIREAEAGGKTKLLNNASQAWNHAFFWDCMTPGGGQPDGNLAEAIQREFKGLDALKETFVAQGAGHFASGWVWLALEKGQLAVTSTHDGGALLGRLGVTPLLVCDLWEHAYYLDYKNDRKSFLTRWFDGVVNWDFAAQQFAAALGEGEGFRYPAPDEETEIGQDRSRPARPGDAQPLHS